MKTKTLSKQIKEIVLQMQESELTEALIYREIAKTTKDQKNRDILNRIADDEERHGKIWQEYTNEEIKINHFKVKWYTFLNRIFGFTFAVRKMELGEIDAQDVYLKIAQEVPEAMDIYKDEQIHEHELIEMLDEEHLKYVGSIVLGLNDALVELTGALAGFTMAYSNIKLMAFSGLITGLAASFSMAASEYLSARADNDPDAQKSAIYTGIAYIITVALLVTPYFVFGAMDIEGAKWYALGVMLTIVLSIIAGFNYYISVAKADNFKKRFWEMAIISLGVAAFSFVIGLVVSNYIGI